MAYISRSGKQPGFYTALSLGVGSIIGSGWLFASFYAAKFAGPVAIFSWIIGALLALGLALMLSEIATFQHERGLFSRLLTISHNKNFGFVVSLSNWLGVVIVMSSEAAATIQYLSDVYPKFSPYIFHHGQSTYLGQALIVLLLIVYACINYWGIRLLAKINNVISSFKLLIPIVTGLLILFSVFHSSNFTSFRGTIAPYGVSAAFNAVVTCGIFYSFFGFNMISLFSKDLKNPQRNIPLALVSSVIICLMIYLLLQVAFIGAMSPADVAKGWHHLQFTSPLAQLMILLNLNLWAVVLYADAAASPSGTGIIYAGSGARMFTGMAQDKQMPEYFSKIHLIHNISRRSLYLTVGLCVFLVIFFNNWRSIQTVASTFQLVSCIAVPLAFIKLRETRPEAERLFRLPLGQIISPVVFILITYLLAQAGIDALVLALVAHVVFFVIYCFSYYKKDKKRIINAFLSAWSIFVYLVLGVVYGYLAELKVMNKPWVLASFVVVTLLLYYWMLNQRDYQPKVAD